MDPGRCWDKKDRVLLFLWLEHPAVCDLSLTPSLALSSGGNAKGDVDPFYYGKPGGPLLPPFLSLSPCAPSWFLASPSPGSCAPLVLFSWGCCQCGLWGGVPDDPSHLLALSSSDYETVRNGGLIFAGLAFVVGLIIILSKWGRSHVGRGVLDGCTSLPKAAGHTGFPGALSPLFQVL